MAMMKVKPMPLMAMTPMMMPAQAQQEVIMRQFFADISRAFQSLAGVMRVSARNRERMMMASVAMKAQEMTLRPSTMAMIRPKMGSR